MGFVLRPEQRSITAGDVIAAVNAQRLGSTDTVPVDVDSAMRLSAVWACIRLIAGVGSTLPLDVYRGTGQSRTEVQSSLFDLPYPDVTLPMWLHQMWVSLLTDGNAYALVSSTSGNGWPTSLELIDPGRVSWTANGERWMARIDGQPVDLFPTGQLWKVSLFTRPGVPFGMSPIDHARYTIGAGLAAERFGGQFFTKGGTPNALLYAESDLTAEQAAAAKQAFVRATSGTREPAVLGAGWRYERVQVSPDEAQFLDAQRFTVEQIARIYGVFPEMIGGAASGSAVTYANREQRAADWLTFGFMPLLVPVEASLSLLVPRPQRVKFNIDAVLRSDLKTRYESYEIAARIGDIGGTPLLGVNEMRDLEDMPPVDGGDQFDRKTATTAASPEGAS